MAWEGGVEVDLAGVARRAGAAMIGAAAVWPALPHVGVLCPLRRLTGIPCPMCGMTTGVVAAVHGDLGAGLAANPAAPVLVLAVLAAWLAWGVCRLAGRPLPRVTAPPALAVGAVFAAMWLFELRRYGFV